MAVEDLLPSFFYANQTGNMTAEQLKRRQAIAQAMAARQRKFPTTLGEGLTYVGESFADRMQEERLRQAELAMAKGDANARTQLLPQQQQAPPVAAPPAGGVPAPTVAPVNAPPPPGANPNSYDVPLPTFGGVPYRPATTVPNTSAEPLTVRDRIAEEVRKQEEQKAATPEVAQANPTLPGSQAPVPSEMLPVDNIQASQGSPASPTSPPGGAPDDIERRRSAIGGIESGGRGDPYSVVGTPTNGNYPLGRYQVMSNNLPEWSRNALGREVSAREFLGNKQIQDAIFDHRFGNYVSRYGDEGAARAWYAGEKGMKNLNATDVHGRLNVGQYGQDYLRRLASLGGARGTMTDVPTGPSLLPRVPGVNDDENPPTPTDIAPAPQVAQMRTTLPGAVEPVSDLLSPVPMAPRAAQAAGPDTSQGIRPRPLSTDPRDPGPQPTMPPPTPDMIRARNVAADPFRGDAVRAEAAQRYTELYNVQHEGFKADLENWKLRKRAFEDPETAIKLRQGAATLTKTEQEIAAGKAPTHTTVDGRVIAWDEATKTWKDVTPPPPGSEAGGPPNIKTTGEQGKTLNHHEKAAIALEQFNRIPNADKILADGLQQELLGRLPFVGNAVLSNRYRQLRNAAENLVQAHLRSVSGASFTAQELTTAHRSLIPIYGDDTGTLAQKRAQREGVKQGLYLEMGSARPLADWSMKKRAEKDAEEQARIAKEMPPNPEVGKIYTNPQTKQRRYWTGTRWQDD